MNDVLRGLTIFCLIALSACALPRATEEPIRSYILEPEWTTFPSLRKPIRQKQAPILQVSPPQPAPGFESPRMAYELIPHEIRYFATSQWVDSPARMLAPLIVDTLDSGSEWKSVIQIPSTIRADYQLDLSDVTVVQEFTQQPSRTRLTLRARLLSVSPPRLIGAHRFAIWEDAPSEDAYGGVQAAHQAVHRFMLELKEWLKGCLNTQPSSQC